MDVILDTEHDALLAKFLSCEKSKNSECKLLYMMLKSSLLFDKKKQCLIEYHFELIKKNKSDDYANFGNLLYLFEELNQYSKRDFKTPFLKIFKEVLQETPDNETDNWDPILPRKHCTIGLMMIYWNCYLEFNKIDGFRKETEKYQIILKKAENSEIVEHLADVSNIIPVFKILSDIIRRSTSQELKKNFIQSYSDEISNIDKFMYKNYNISITYDLEKTESNESFHEKYSAWFSFLFLYAAIKTNQLDIVKKIFEYQNFLTLTPSFPVNMEISDIQKEVAILFLENRYELGRDVLPKQWITHDVLERFLESRISQEDTFYKIDCRFMLPYYNYGIKNEKKEEDANECINDDYLTMEYILNDRNLRTLVTNPVMEIFIRVKMEKYIWVTLLNLFLFVAFYIIPTSILAYQLRAGNHKASNTVDGKDDLKIDVNYICALGCISVCFIYLGVKAAFRIKMIEGLEWSNYWKKQFDATALFGLLVIILILFLGYIFTTSNGLYTAIVIFNTLNIISAAIVTVSLMPVLKFVIFIKCFIQVLMTYWNVFFIFFPLIIGSAVIVFTFFDKNLGGNIEIFEQLETTIVRYMFMYFGDIGIDINKYSKILQIFTIIVIIVFLINISNLIMSIVINDTREMINQSKRYNLELNAKKYVRFAKNIRFFYVMKIE